MKVLDDHQQQRGKSNVFDSSKLNQGDRVCRHCNLKLVQRINEPLVYACPACNVSANVTDTYPQPKVRITFPSHDPTIPSNQHAKVLQSEDQKLPRSELYYRRRQRERDSETEANDLMLQKLRSMSNINIKDVYYTDPTEGY